MSLLHKMSLRGRFRGLLFAANFVFVLAVSAADVAVRSSVSRAVSTVGEAVQYHIKITGARRVAEPPQMNVDGLAIRYAGPSESSSIRVSNGSISTERTVTLIYQVVPEKTGSFTIPAAAVDVDGQTFRTEPVALKVQPRNAADAGNDPQSYGYAEFVVGKSTAYIGETLPIELRLYVDARIRWQPVSMPEISGEGFTKQKMPEPQRDQVQKNGREYDLLVFKTTITPSRAGKITLGPSEIAYNARVPRARRGGSRSLFDMFDDDVFGDPFFSSVQQMKAKVAAAEITVKPLPAVGRPREFSGAVGEFKMAAEGAPKRVKVGDPVTMTARVSGRGNFDRVAAPTLADAAGWRTYPASSSFKADAGDELSYAGTKTFEMAVVPESEKDAMPVLQFSYFDPAAEKYVTLNSERLPLMVEPGAAPVAVAKPRGEMTLPEPKLVVSDGLLGLRYDAQTARHFTPLHRQRGFWFAQGGVALAFTIMLGLKLRRMPRADVVAAAEMSREKAALLQRLRREELDRAEFLRTAARIAQIETALATAQPVENVDWTTMRGSAAVGEETKTTLDELFAARAELLYAGAGTGGIRGSISASERERVLSALRELEEKHGRV